MFNLILLFPVITTVLLTKSKNSVAPLAPMISITLMGCTFLLSVYAFYNVVLLGDTLPIYLPLWTWLDVELLTFDFGGYFDTLSTIMLIVVTSISLMVHIYSTEYMKHDMSLQRFLGYLSLFTFFMIVLVTSNNFIQLFTGWEGVGLCSYLLINFWYTRIQANKAAIKAVIVNRIGDTAFAIAIFLIFKFTGALDFDTVFLVADTLTKEQLNLICLFLLIGAMGKSAQIGLHTWLPDAMEGPTPVSALIHAATMVTAGVFLILRCSFMFSLAEDILILMTIVGSLTTFFAATTALFQTDLKKVIAYSTCSQLGYMITACGLCNYSASIFHLSNHAFFKALLFLTAGSIIHALSNEQDMRRMGGLSNLLPFSYAMILIGSLALCGFPFLSGYYSKDFILEFAYATSTTHGRFAYWLGSFSALLTTFYSFRLIFLVFFNQTNIRRKLVEKIHDAPILMALPMFILSIFSIFIGYLSKDLFIGAGTPFWGNSLAWSATAVNTGLTVEFLPFTFKILPSIFSLFGFIFLIGIYSTFINTFQIKNMPRAFYSFFNFLSKKWYFDKVYNEYIVQYFLSLGYNVTYKSVDRGILEIVGPTNLYLNLQKAAINIIKQEADLPFKFIRTFIFSILYIGFFSTACIIFNLPLELLFIISYLIWDFFKN